ncbi:MAG: nucleotidyl transferase AbiEii/AbiGii toxin family protein, partial [Vicinamibacteria bacterium]
AARLGSSRITLRVDIGFGNAIVPGPEELEYRTLLGDPPPRILAYPKESVVAEKLHAMVTLGERNSRYKDFYDLHALAGGFEFDLDTLVRAFRATFNRRATPFPAEPPAALAAAFYSSEERGRQWRAYVSRNDLSGVPLDFVQIGDRITRFLAPTWQHSVSGEIRAGDWRDGGPWRFR